MSALPVYTVRYILSAASRELHLQRQGRWAYWLNELPKQPWQNSCIILEIHSQTITRSSEVNIANGWPITRSRMITRISAFVMPIFQVTEELITARQFAHPGPFEQPACAFSLALICWWRCSMWPGWRAFCTSWIAYLILHLSLHPLPMSFHVSCPLTVLSW